MRGLQLVKQGKSQWIINPNGAENGGDQDR